MVDNSIDGKKNIEYSEIKYMSENVACDKCLGSNFVREVKGIADCRECKNTGLVKTILDGVLVSC